MVRHWSANLQIDEQQVECLLQRLFFQDFCWWHAFLLHGVSQLMLSDPPHLFAFIEPYRVHM